jgi:hypothetical protein
MKSNVQGQRELQTTIEMKFESMSITNTKS